MKQGESHPAGFRHLVTSPTGTTIERTCSLEGKGLRDALMKATLDTYLWPGAQ